MTILGSALHQPKRQCLMCYVYKHTYINGKRGILERLSLKHGTCKFVSRDVHCSNDVSDGNTNGVGPKLEGEHIFLDNIEKGSPSHIPRIAGRLDTEAKMCLWRPEVRGQKFP